MKKKQQLKFYDKNHPFGALANTAELKVQFSIDGNVVDAPSSECIYQAVKGLLNPNQNYKPLGQAILEGKHGYARSVQIAGQGFNSSHEIKVIHNNSNGAPEALKYYLMRDIVKAKLTQHPVLLKALMEKVNAGYEIIEDAPTDAYWGIGAGTGQNKLGQILTEVTKELNAEMLQTGKFKIYNSFSINTITMIKAAGLLEPKIPNIPDKFVTSTEFYNLPTNCNTESEIANHYNINNNVQTNNSQQSFTINANNMKGLANELMKKGQFFSFSTKSKNGVEVKCQVEQNGIVTIYTKNRHGVDVKIIYNTKTNQVTENNQQVFDSKLGDWAFGIIKNCAEKNMQAVESINTQNNSNNSTKTTLIPVNKTTEPKVANYYNNNKIVQNNNQQPFTTTKQPFNININANNMKGLANELMKKGQFFSFSTKSKNGVEVKCQVEQNGAVTVDTEDRHGRGVKIIYNTKTNQVTENNQQVVDSKLGDWAFGVIKNYVQTNNSQQSFTINANNMKDLAGELMKKGQFGIFSTKSKNGVEVKCQVEQNGTVTVYTEDRHGGDVKIIYNTKTNQVTENGKLVVDSKLGDWAFGVIKNYVEKNMQAVESINTQNNSNNSTKTTLVSVKKSGDYKDFLKQVIKLEPSCKFAIKSKFTLISVVIKHSQEIVIKGTDYKGNPITVIESVNGRINENGNEVTNSDFMKWATGPIEWAVNHADQVTVEALGANDWQ